MKKLFLLICFIFLCLPVFAEYKPIPKELSKQYRVEMEQIIDNGYPQAISYINDYYNEVLKTSFIPEVSIYDANLFIYADMMKVTQEKYLKTKYKPCGTDNSVSAAEFLTPYFKDNNVNIEKLIEIDKYAKLTDKKINILTGQHT